MLNRINSEKGFTLIELTIVVAVIVILATLSIAVYTSFLKRARVVEAKTFLSDLGRQQTAYYVANAEYTDAVTQLGLPGLGTLRYYEITVTVPGGLSPQSYLAMAKGNIDSDPDPADDDIWTINQDVELVHVYAD